MPNCTELSKLCIILHTYVRSLHYQTNERFFQSYKLSLLLRQSWVDKRLAFTDDIIDDSRRDYISLPGSASRLLWLPDTFVVNERASSLHDVTIQNKLLRIYHDGSVLLSQRSVHRRRVLLQSNTHSGLS